MIQRKNLKSDETKLLLPTKRRFVLLKALKDCRGVENKDADIMRLVNENKDIEETVQACKPVIDEVVENMNTLFPIRVEHWRLAGAFVMRFILFTLNSA